MYGEHDAPDKFIPAMVRRIKSNEPEIEVTPGEQKRDFIHVTDVARAFHVVATSSALPDTGFNTFQVGTGSSHTIRDTLSLIQQATSSATELLFGKLPYRENECMQSEADISDLQALGWSPLVSWEAGFTALARSTHSGEGHA